MFKKVLIANRGEIAVRVMRSLRELGIASVAVYSEADRDALHVRMADEAYLIGPAPSRESYLRGDVILEVAARCGAEAIHPGYGFLSENADFARQCAEAGVVFIGPSPEAIVAMGSKTQARALMAKAGVPLVPGTPEAIADPQLGVEFARSAGFPVLIKASAGGGGKGMRLVHREEDFVSSFDAARREAASAFGDDAVYIEKYVVHPKHVELQVLADTHGHVVHLFERECSVQRRHQKIVEEAPCPTLREEVRQRMGEVAVTAARSVDYVGAGTVEFLIDVDQNFYFLEMNTRLQVEHPITELITGIDLVRWQLKIAAGQHLTLQQRDIQRRGHAIECRIYAEDPDQNFMPSPGPIPYMREPHGPGVRLDSGVYSGASVPQFYDPMIAKLATWGEDREHAIARMRRALSELVVSGIRSNVDFHEEVLTHPAFVDASYDTEFVALLLSERATGASAADEEAAWVAQVAAALVTHQQAEALASKGGAAAGAPRAPGRDAGRWETMARLEQLRRW